MAFPFCLPSLHDARTSSLASVPKKTQGNKTKLTNEVHRETNEGENYTKGKGSFTFNALGSRRPESMSSPYSAGSLVAFACLNGKMHMKQLHQAAADNPYRIKWEKTNL